MNTLSTLKKTLIGLVCVFGLGTFFFGGDAWSYLTTATGKVQSAVVSNVPIEFEIDRAKNQVAGLLPEIKTNMDIIAKEEVEIERLDEQIARLQDRMVTSKDEVLTLQEDLTAQADSVRFVYSGKSYTRSQVETDLDNRLKRYQVDETTLASLHQMCNVRATSLETARKQLQEYLATKRELEVKIESLAARKKMVDLAKTTSEYQFNDGNLGDVKQLVTDIENRIAVEERLVGSSTDLANEVVLDGGVAVETADVTERVAKYFNIEQQPETGLVADK